MEAKANRKHKVQSSIFAGIIHADKDAEIAGKDNFQCLSWVQPNSSNPDFHISSAIGTFKFE